jgi:hypothetical protein
MRAQRALAHTKELHDHEAGNRAGLEGQAERDARPGDHRRRRPARHVAQGQNPGQTIYSVLYSESKKPTGLVVQVDRGTFKLNPKRARSTKAQA